ncbi:MAG: CPBP family intramembrane metalloprotease [Bacilli bacterium]|nr:CPBP family intramembrane metalloprotease [Bacilli bacterium]
MKKYTPVIIFMLLLVGMDLFAYIPIKVFNIDMKSLSTSTMIIYNFISDLVFLTIVFLIYRKKLIKEFREFFSNFSDNIFISLEYYLVGLIIMLVSNYLIGYFFSNASANNENLVRLLIDKYPLYMLFSVAIYAPLVEETIFRRSLKDIFDKFGKNKLIKYMYIICSGLIFSLLHVMGNTTSSIDYIYIIPYAALGFCFASLYYKTDNLFSTIILHSFHNLVALILYLVLGG